MNETKDRLANIELIQDEMDKTLSEECLIKCFIVDFWYSKDDFIRKYSKDIPLYEWQEEDWLYYDEILWHYWTTAITKYIVKTSKVRLNVILSADLKYYYFLDSHHLSNYPTWWYNFKIPNKEAYLYNAKEDSELNKILLKLN